MRITIIAAMDTQRLIGKGAGLPWRLPADLKHFKALTLGKPVIMGRKTFETIGKPLPGRTNIVISRDPDYAREGVVVAHDLQEALDVAQQVAGPEAEVMVAGGANVYFQFLPRADRMELTLVHGQFEGDAWFPAYDRRDWGVIREEHHPADADNGTAYSFITLQRRHPHDREALKVSFGRW
ncbi:MAG: dihydrofolate reductase [Pseudomonadota bacterium]